MPTLSPDNVTILPTGPGINGTVTKEGLPSGVLADATGYGFHVRVQDDQGAWSDWSSACYFRTVPGQGEQWSNFVPLDQPGGSASVSLAPPADGPNDLTVAAIDVANDLSQPTSYSFLVTSTPSHTLSAPAIGADADGKLGEPFTVSFSVFEVPAEFGAVVSYEYTVNGGPTQTVAADANNHAEVQLTFTNPDVNTLTVWYTTADGSVSPTTTDQYDPDSPPDVSSPQYPEGGAGGGASQPGTFTFVSHLPGATEFVYSFDDVFDDSDGAPQTVPVGPDGTATVTFTPDAADIYFLTVYSRIDDATQSWVDSYMFIVNGQHRTNAGGRSRPEPGTARGCRKSTAVRVQVVSKIRKIVWPRSGPLHSGPNRRDRGRGAPTGHRDRCRIMGYGHRLPTAPNGHQRHSTERRDLPEPGFPQVTADDGPC